METIKKKNKQKKTKLKKTNKYEFSRFCIFNKQKSRIGLKAYMQSLNLCGYKYYIMCI